MCIQLLNFKMYHFKMKPVCVSVSSVFHPFSVVLFALLLVSLGLPAGMLGSVADSTSGNSASWSRTPEKAVRVLEVPFENVPVYP